MKSNSDLFCTASQLCEYDELHMLLLWGSTWFGNHKYLESLENTAELIDCVEK